MSAKLPVAISFSSIANFLGTIGVIGSLIFVGLELRQSHKIALAGKFKRGMKSPQTYYSLQSKEMSISLV